VNVGDKVIDYNEGFRMYLVTRNPQPDIPPDAAALVTTVNFTGMIYVCMFILIYVSIDICLY
jgi:hypothetical protein